MKASISSFADEFVKISALVPSSSISKALSTLMKNKGALKYPAVGLGSIGAYTAGKQGLDDWRLGRAIRKRHEGAQGG